MTTFRNYHVVCKENVVATSKRPAGNPVGQTPSHLPEVKAPQDRLREIRTEAVIADVLDGFAEIERGEVVEMTLDDLTREIERCQPNLPHQS